MGTEVLRPQDCLIERIRVSPAVFQHHRRKNFYGNGNGSSNPKLASRKPAVRPEQKKRVQNGRSSEPSMSRRAASLDDLRKGHNHHHGNLVMGHVTILRRGESLDSKINSSRHQPAPANKTADDLVLCGTERLGPDPAQIGIRDLKSVLLSPASGAGDRPDVYAGSAVSMSPSPRSLPLPSFFNKKQVSKTVDDSATRDLRRLLRLD